MTIILPVYNEATTLAPLVESLLETTRPHGTRIILIDDGSTDGSSGICDDLSHTYKEVDVIHFAENCGKTAALRAGFDAAEGDLVITMDSDLQDDPSEIPRFIDAVADGLDMVCGWKADRQDPLVKRIASRVYNGFTALLFRLPLHDINCGFKAMRLDVAKSLSLDHDYHRLIPVLAAAQGYRVGELKVRHHPRRSGKSKYGIERYWHGLRDVARLWWQLRFNRDGGAST